MTGSGRGVDLIAYVFGDLSDDEAARVEALANSDPEVQAKLAVIRASLAWKAPKAKTFRRFFPAAVAVIVIVVGVGAACVIFVPKALLSDNFNDAWFDSRIWLQPPEFGGKRGIKEQNGYLKLVNRGYLVTREEFSEPFSLSFDWSWSDFGLNPVYADHLVVVLRTTGEAARERPFEVKDGVTVRFNAWTGQVYIDAEPNHRHYAATAPGSIKMSPEAWHHIRITDDGHKVAVYMSGPAVADDNPDVPILSAECPDVGTAGHIAIYNREELAGIPHESYIDNVVVRAIRPQ